MSGAFLNPNTVRQRAAIAGTAAAEPTASDSTAPGFFDIFTKIGVNSNYGDKFYDQDSEAYTPNNANYKVIIQQVNSGGGDRIGDVVGTAPMELEFQLQNNYVDFSHLFEAAAPAAMAGQGRGPGGLLAAGTAVSGMYNQSRIGSFQVWGGVTPLQFPLTITFRAYKDPMKEVIVPVRNLLAMASPKNSGIFLDTPGPSLWDALQAAKNGSFFTSLNKSILLRIGRRFALAGLVIESISARVSNQADRKSGLPIAIEVNVGFKTVASYSREEIISAFYGTNFATRTTRYDGNTSAY